MLSPVSADITEYLCKAVTSDGGVICKKTEYTVDNCYDLSSCNCLFGTECTVTVAVYKS